MPTHALDMDVVYHSEEIGRLSRQQGEASRGIVKDIRSLGFTTEKETGIIQGRCLPPAKTQCYNILRAPLKTLLFRDGGVSRVLKSSCIRPYIPVFRARLPCPHKKNWFLEVPLNRVSDFSYIHSPWWRGSARRMLCLVRLPFPLGQKCFLTPLN